MLLHIDFLTVFAAEIVGKIENGKNDLHQLHYNKRHHSVENHRPDHLTVFQFIN